MIAMAIPMKYPNSPRRFQTIDNFRQGFALNFSRHLFQLVNQLEDTQSVIGRGLQLAKNRLAQHLETLSGWAGAGARAFVVLGALLVMW